MSRWVKWRKVLLVLAIVVAIASVGGAVTLVLAYNEATKIDRSNPKIVLDEYLRASLVRQDEVGAGLYSCDTDQGLKALAQLSEELDQREKRFGVEILLSWGAITRSESSAGAVLTTDLNVTAVKDGSEQSNSSQTWEFILVDQDGWRVCDAKRLPNAKPSLTPTP